jgi:hypothetical protein
MEKKIIHKLTCFGIGNGMLENHLHNIQKKASLVDMVLILGWPKTKQCFYPILFALLIGQIVLATIIATFCWGRAKLIASLIGTFP